MTSITAQEQIMTLPAGLVIGEPFSHTAPGTRGVVRYNLAPVYLVDGDIEEPAGVLVAGEPHRLCRRCGLGFGHYAFNGEHDLCYECGGDGYGAEATFEDLARLAKNRVAARRRAAEKAEREARERAEALAAWKAANADLVEALKPYAPKVDLYSGEGVPVSGFFGDMAARIEWAPLTARQTEATRAAFAKKAAEIVSECPEGRVVIEGVILSLKEVEDSFSYYGGTITKAVVKDDRGFRVYGTLPSSLRGDLFDRWAGIEQAEKGDDFSFADYGPDYWQGSAKGARVRFTATVERSRKDADFGFYKRPTKASVLPAE